MTGRKSAGGTRRLAIRYDAPTTTESFEGPFLSVARRHSLCDDDAWEALGRSFEIALRRRNRIRPETAGAWFATVVRHEAMRVRHGRYRELPIDAAAYEPPAEQPEPEREPDPRLPALRAAMRQLKPDERRALILFYGMDADGRRYRRIANLSRGVCVNGGVMLRSDVGDMSLMKAAQPPFVVPREPGCPRLGAVASILMRVHGRIPAWPIGRRLEFHAPRTRLIAFTPVASFAQCSSARWPSSFPSGSSSS